MRQFRALRFVAGFYRVLAWIGLILGILGGLAVMVFGVLGTAMRVPGVAADPLAAGVLGSIFMGLLTILGAVLYFIFLYATSDIFLVGLAIEQNTRETVNYLREDVEGYSNTTEARWEPRREPPPPPPPPNR